MESLEKKGKSKSSFGLFLKVLGAVLGIGLCALLFIALIQYKKNENIQNATENIIENTTDKPVITWDIGSSATSEQEMVSLGDGKYAELLASAQQMQEQNAYPVVTRVEDKITFVFGGDVLLDENYAVMSNYRNQGGDISKCISEEILQRMQNADICMINNEFPYTNRGEPLPNKAFTFHANPNNVTVLKEMGVDIVSIANNHISDYGEVSLLDTLDTLDGAQILHVGAGRNLEEASKPVYYITENMKIAVIAATQLERISNPDTKGATENTAGTYRCMEPENLIETIKEAKANSDFVILYVHWGVESEEQLHWRQPDQAREYAEAGADLIIGAHPHILQQIAYVEDTPIFYSIGNLWFSSKTLDGGMVEATFTPDGLESCRFIPTLQQNAMALSANEADYSRIMNHMREISLGVSIDENGYVSPSP